MLVESNLRLPRDSLSCVGTGCRRACNAPCKGIRKRRRRPPWPALWLLPRSSCSLSVLLSISPYRSLCDVGPSANLRRSSESFRSPALPQEIVPTVSGSKPAVEEVVTLLAGNLEADVTETLSRGDGLLTLAANDGCPEFHRSPPKLCLRFLVGQLFSYCFQILVGLLQTRSFLVNGPEYFEVVDSNSDFGFVRLEKLLNNEQFFVERVLRRVVWQEIDLAYEVIPGDIAHDVNDRGTTLCSIG